ncbi:MAG: outer membrane protein OmpA-like peptidoglycan-associated protein [Limisphaerales bacterium]|jgi:outer membrane protein OmpA-like peptidoglycan-associated protein/tetratricopeptide (TPR) repeat protein
MKFQNILFVLVLLCANTVCSAQSVLRSKADQYFENYAYALATPVYEQLASKKADKSLYLRLGECYRMLNRYDDAEKLYRKGIRGESVKPEYFLYYAQMLQINGNYDEAIKWYTRYNKEESADSRGKFGLEACENLMNEATASLDYHIESHSANTKFSEISPLFIDEGMLFVSSRITGEINEKKFEGDQWTGEGYMNLYMEWESGETTILSESLKGEFHEGPASWDDDSSTLYFTKSTQISKKSQGLGIFFTRRSDIGWSEPKRIIIPGLDGPGMHPAFDPKNKILYFTAIPENGYGGYDICKTTKTDIGWSELELLDASINSMGDDMFPQIDKSGHLWFASDGKSGYGGLDIFVFKGEGQPELLPAPVNSTYDDFSIAWKENGSGAFSSNRPGGIGGDDLYEVFSTASLDIIGYVLDKEENAISGQEVSITLPNGNTVQVVTDSMGQFECELFPFQEYEFYAQDTSFNEGSIAWTPTTQDGAAQSPPVITLEEHFVHINGEIETDDGSPIGESTLEVINLNDLSSEIIELDSSGVFSTTLSKGPEYEIRPDKESYLALPQRINSNDYTSGDTSFMSVYMKIIEEGLVMEVVNVYYDFALWEMRLESMFSINRIAEMLNRYPEMKIELASHTDSRATAPHNLKLSQKRSDHVKSLLVSKGIAPSRISPMGYGETMLRNHCTDDIECTEDEHQYNRRSEFKVISF